MGRVFSVEIGGIVGFGGLSAIAPPEALGSIGLADNFFHEFFSLLRVATVRCNEKLVSHDRSAEPERVRANGGN